MKTLQKQDYWDIALAVFLVVISIVTLVGISNVREFDYEPLGPTFLPKALSYCFLVMSGLLIVKMIIRRSKEQEQESLPDEGSNEAEAEVPASHPWLAVLAVGLISAFIASMKFLGFRVTSLVFMIVLGAILIKYERKSNKKRNLISLAIIAIVLSFGLFYIFRELLGVRVP